MLYEVITFGSILYTFGYASVELYWECTDSHSGMTAGYNKETDHEHKLGDIIVTDYDEEYVLKMCLSGETEIDTIAYMADVDEYMNSLGETE